MVDSKQSQFDTSHALRFFPTLLAYPVNAHDRYM